jgi:hypothetical protein
MVGQPSGIIQNLGCPLSKPHKYGGPIPGLEAAKTAVTALKDEGGDSSNQKRAGYCKWVCVASLLLGEHLV